MPDEPKAKVSWLDRLREKRRQRKAKDAEHMHAMRGPESTPDKSRRDSGVTNTSSFDGGM